MPDFLDRAQREEERLLAQALAAARRTVDGPVPNGLCLFCGEPQVEGARRWCDFSCAQAWQKERSLLRQAPVGKGGPQP